MSGRYSTYLTERFPILTILPAALLFALSAALYPTAPSDVPFSFGAYFCSAFVAFAFLALTRIADEHRDLKYDTVHHPERPVPSGLVTLHELRIGGLVLLALMVIFSFLVSPRLLIPLGIVFIYYILNSFSFFMKNRILKHTQVFIFARVLILFFLDAFTVFAQVICSNIQPAIWSTLCYMCCRLFAAYALDIALRKNHPHAAGFNKIRHMLLFGSTVISFLLFIVSMLSLHNTILIYIIAALGFIICLACIFFSNTNHRLLRLEKFGTILYCLIVVLLPCFASRLM